MVIWKPLVGVFLQCVKEPTNEVDKNDNAVICTTSYCKKEVVRNILQNISVILPSFYLCPILLQLNASTMEVNTDWKSLQILIFVDLKRRLNQLKNKTTKCKTLKHCLKQNVCKCITRNVLYGLLLGVPAIERSVLGGNVSSDLKIMSAIERYPLHRGFVARVRPSFDTILRKVFVVEIKVSAIKDPRYKEVSL